jgi:tetratricopeptide (TPR) repeat protein
MKWMFLCVLIAMLGGCATSSGEYSRDPHGRAAARANSVGDWRLAQKEWHLAIDDAIPAHATATELYAVALYEYGRASGVLCQWSEAERSLKEAVELDQKLHGPVYMSTYELALLYLEQGQGAAARPYFERTDYEMLTLGADRKAPVGYAEFLDEYASALDLAASHDDADAKRSRAKQIREAFPRGHSITDRTPYGTLCGSS